MDNTGQAKTTMFEHALGVGLGIFDMVVIPDSAPVVEPGRKSTNAKAKNKTQKKKSVRRDN